MYRQWAPEFQALNRILTSIQDFERDVAMIKSIAPRQYLNHLNEKVLRISNSIKNSRRHSFFNSRIGALEKLIKQCRDNIATLMVQVQAAETIASDITQQCKTITNDIANLSATERYKLNKLIGSSDRIFETIRTAGANVWSATRSKLDSFAGFVKPDTTYEHNTLACLLLTNDETFIQYINDGRLPIEGEIGHLIIQRLRDIQFLEKTETESGPRKNMRAMAGKAISRAMNIHEPENILQCDFSALYIEITKLALHAQLHPDHKVFWLGTARVVNRMIQDRSGLGTYLNCDDTLWSWHLNRIWLQAAIYLGYSCQLIEQHFPNIDKALLSADSSNFIRELLKEIRSEGPENTSQYNGNDSPTATTQEILVLMDMGCAVTKNEDQSISFSKPTVREAPTPSRLRLNSHSSAFDVSSPYSITKIPGSRSSIKDRPSSAIRSHSWDNHVASPGVFGIEIDQFFNPIPSKEIRGGNNGLTPNVTGSIPPFPQLS